MARNRRRVDGEVTFSWIAARLLLFTLLVGVLLSITFLKNRNLRLGDDLRQVDRELKLAMEKTESLKSQLARYKAPQELEAKNSKWKMGMVRAEERQIRRFREPQYLPSRKTKSNMIAQVSNPSPEMP
jgi:hypothetical protein